MKWQNLVWASMLVFTACGKGTANNAGTKSHVSDSEFADAQNMNTNELTQKAMNSDLGVCVVRSVGNRQPGCANGESFVVSINDKNLYYPSMTVELADSPTCYNSVGALVKQALNDGLCYANPIPINRITDEGLTRRGLAADFGHCIVYRYGTGVGGCSYDAAYTIYLMHKKVYYPSMTTAPSTSLACRTQIGSWMRQAYNDGLCNP